MVEDKRTHLLTQLGEYEPIDSNDAEVRQRFVAFVEENPDCFERSLRAGHLTGSAWLVNSTRTKVLLTHHRKLNRWLQLGGHADGEADLLKVALREAQEESGIDDIAPLGARIFDLDVHEIPAHGPVPRHFHYDVRFALVAGRETIKVSEESHALEWVSFQELSQRTKEWSLLRMRDKWLRAILKNNDA